MANSAAGELSGLETAIVAQLVRATVDRHHEWRTPTLATVTEDAGELRADARTVVLREAAPGRLTFFTDARSPKVAQICARPQGTLVFWSRKLSWQLRVACALSVATEGERVRAAFAGIAASASAKDYFGAFAPGEAIASPVATAASGASPWFALVDATITSMDWLELARDGHRRARFWPGEKGGRATWLAP
jgi:pyridoxamine 5'-phosphate oxidase